jgi:hypothetical protein
MCHPITPEIKEWRKSGALQHMPDICAYFDALTFLNRLKCIAEFEG